MGNTVVRKLLSNIREACWFTIIADETRDISNHEQLAIAIRWVGSTYDIHEELVHVPSTTSATLTVSIKANTQCLLELVQLPAHSEHTWTAVCPGSEWAGSTDTHSVSCLWLPDLTCTCMP